MKVYFFLTFLFLFNPNNYAQTTPSSLTNGTYTFWNTDMETIAKANSKDGFVYLKDNSSVNILNNNKTAFGLSANSNMLLEKSKVLSSNYAINRYQHMVDSVEIENSTAVLHIINGMPNSSQYKFNSYSLI